MLGYADAKIVIIYKNYKNSNLLVFRDNILYNSFSIIIIDYDLQMYLNCL